MKRADIISAYSHEVQRCLDITMRRIKVLSQTHTGGREAGLAEGARIAGAYRAHLVTLAEACERACDTMVDEPPAFPQLVL